MQKSLIALSLALTAPMALAQTCFDNTFGTVLFQNQSDFVSPITPIGFAFPLNGATFTDMHVSDHGIVYLSNAGVPTPPASSTAALWTPSTANFAAGSPKICPLYSDTIGDVGTVYVNSSPTKCVITWTNMHSFGIPAPLFDFQVQLFPSGEVKMAYGPNVTNNSTFGGVSDNAILGITPGGGAVLPPSSDLSVSGASANPSVYENWVTAQTFDLADNGVYFIPTSPGYTWIPGNNGCAKVSTYGIGCINAPDTFHEIMTAAAFDLNGKTITLLRSPGSYTMLDGIPGTFVTPTGGATVIANGDDVQSVVTLPSAMPIANGTTTSLAVCSNGFITFDATGNGTFWVPSADDIRNNPGTALYPFWHDMNPSLAGSGQITFEVITGVAYVSFNNVYNFGQTSGVGNTFQVQFDLATGNITIVYVSTNGLGNDCGVGYSVGGPSALSPVDVSAVATTTYSVFDTAVEPLTISTTTRPLINSTFPIDVTNVPALAPIAFVGFGDTVVNPGLDVGFIGMPGCRAYTNLNLGLYQTGLVTAGVGTLPLSIPNSPSIVGTVLSAQGVALSLATPLNLIASNGMRIEVGN
jgi:hypothetical protein